MARSKARITRDNQARVRCKTIIATALRKYTGPRQAAAIAANIEGNAVLTRKIEHDKSLLRYLWVEGLKIEIRAALAEWDAVGDGAEAPPQFELFPGDEQGIVRRVGMARIWVPSLDAHVQYHPASGLAPDRLREAASYYVGLSIGLARTSAALVELAQLREHRPPAIQSAA